MTHVVVYITDQSLGVENLQPGVTVEVRDYREASNHLRNVDARTDEHGVWYTSHIFTGLDLLEYECRACGKTDRAPDGTDPIDLCLIGRYCDECGGNDIDTPGGP